MKCEHDLAEMETARAMDGLCPICLLSRIHTLEEGIKDALGYTLPYLAETTLRKLLEKE